VVVRNADTHNASRACVLEGRGEEGESQVGRRRSDNPYNHSAAAQVRRYSRDLPPVLSCMLGPHHKPLLPTSRVSCALQKAGNNPLDHEVLM